MADEEKKTSAKSEKKSAKKADAKADKSKSGKKKKNPFKSIATFFKSVRAEGKKVVWSSGKDVLKNSLTVLVVVIIAGLCIYGVDTLLSLGMKGIKNLADQESTSVSETTTAQTTAEALTESTTADTTTQAAE